MSGIENGARAVVLTALLGAGCGVPKDTVDICDDISSGADARLFEQQSRNMQNAGYDLGAVTVDDRMGFCVGRDPYVGRDDVHCVKVLLGDTRKDVVKSGVFSSADDYSVDAYGWDCE